MSLRATSTRFKTDTDLFCRWVSKAEARVAEAGTREAVAALRGDLDGKWEKIQEKWQELLLVYPEPETITDETGNVIEDEDKCKKLGGRIASD